MNQRVLGRRPYGRVQSTAPDLTLEIGRGGLGVSLFDRLPRGGRLSAAGASFLDDARRILQQVNEAAVRA